MDPKAVMSIIPILEFMHKNNFVHNNVNDNFKDESQIWDINQNVIILPFKNKSQIWDSLTSQIWDIS